MVTNDDGQKNIASIFGPSLRRLVIRKQALELKIVVELYRSIHTSKL